MNQIRNLRKRKSPTRSNVQPPTKELDLSTEAITIDIPSRSRKKSQIWKHINFPPLSFRSRREELSSPYVWVTPEAIGEDHPASHPGGFSKARDHPASPSAPPPTQRDRPRRSSNSSSSPMELCRRLRARKVVNFSQLDQRTHALPSPYVHGPTQSTFQRDVTPFDDSRDADASPVTESASQPGPSSVSRSQEIPITNANHAESSADRAGRSQHPAENMGFFVDSLPGMRHLKNPWQVGGTVIIPQPLLPNPQPLPCSLVRSHQAASTRRRLLSRKAALRADWFASPLRRKLSTIPEGSHAGSESGLMQVASLNEETVLSSDYSSSSNSSQSLGEFRSLYRGVLPKSTSNAKTFPGPPDVLLSSSTSCTASPSYLHDERQGRSSDRRPSAPKPQHDPKLILSSLLQLFDPYPSPQ